MQTNRGPKKFLDVTREGMPNFDDENAEDSDGETRDPGTPSGPTSRQISEPDLSSEGFRGGPASEISENLQPNDREAPDDRGEDSRRQRERSPRRPSGTEIADNMRRWGEESFERSAPAVPDSQAAG